MNAAESSISCPKARLSLAVARAMPKQLHPGAQGNGGHPMLFRQAIVVISDVVAVAHGNRIQIRPFPPTPRRRTPIADSQGGSGSFGCTTCLAGVDAGLLNSSLSGERGERNRGPPLPHCPGRRGLRAFEVDVAPTLAR